MHYQSRQLGGFSHQPLPQPQILNSISKSKSPGESDFRVHFYLKNLFCGNMEPEWFINLVAQRISKVGRVQLLQVSDQVDDKHVDVSVGLDKDLDAMSLIVGKDKKILIFDHQTNNLKQYEPIPSRVFESYILQNMHLVQASQNPPFLLAPSQPQAYNQTPSQIPSPEQTALPNKGRTYNNLNEDSNTYPNFGRTLSGSLSPNPNLLKNQNYNNSSLSAKNHSSLSLIQQKSSNDSVKMRNRSQQRQHKEEKVVDKLWQKLDRTYNFNPSSHEHMKAQPNQAQSLHGSKKKTSIKKDGSSSDSSVDDSPAYTKVQNKKELQPISQKKNNNSSDSSSLSSQSSSSSSSSTSSESSIEEYKVEKIWIFAVPAEYNAKEVVTQLEDNKLSVSFAEWRQHKTMQYLEVELRELVPQKVIQDLRVRIYGYPVIVIPQLKNQSYILIELARFHVSVKFRRHVSEQEVILFANKCGPVVVMVRDELEDRFIVVFNNRSAIKSFYKVEQMFKDSRIEKVKQPLKIGRIDKLFTFQELVKSLDTSTNRTAKN